MVFGITATSLESIIEDKESAYNDLDLVIKGKNRTIHAMERNSSLYKCQKLLCDKVLENYKLPVCVKGFVKGKSYKDFLENHIGQEYYLRIDIKDFFGSISKSDIEPFLVNYFLSFHNDKEATSLVVADIIEMCTLADVLPQGAVTSPIISNIVFSRLDQRITKYCQKIGVRYTRYADDLLFSSDSFDFSDKDWFFKRIQSILLSQSFEINHRKTRYANEEISLNGFVINEEMRLSRKRLSEIVAILRFCEDTVNVELIKDKKWNALLRSLNRYTLPYRKNAFSSPYQLLQFLLGYRAFLLSWIEPKSVSQNQKRIHKLIKRLEKSVKLISSNLYST